MGIFFSTFPVFKSKNCTVEACSLATTIRFASAGRVLARGATTTANRDASTIELVRTAVFIVRTFLQGSLHSSLMGQIAHPQRDPSP